jgi:hypothetical protein
MGAAVTKLLNTLSNDDEEEKDLRELVQSLQRQAESEAEIFYGKVLHSNLQTDKLLPIQCVLYKYSNVEVVAANDNQSLLSFGIKDTIQKVTNSNIAGAITGVLSIGIKALLEKRGSEVSVEEGYTVSIGKLGGVERLDYRVSMQTFSSDTWRKKMSNVLTTTVVVSSCDIEQLRHNDSTVLVQQCFGTETYDVQTAIRDMLYLALDTSLTPEEKTKQEIGLIKIIEENYTGAIAPKDEAKVKAEFEKWQSDQIKLMQEKTVIPPAPGKK